MATCSLAGTRRVYRQRGSPIVVENRKGVFCRYPIGWAKRCAGKC